MPLRRAQLSQLAYEVAVVALFSWAAWLRISAPFEPIADSDVWGYLSPAVGKLTGGDFAHAGRNFVYPGFLYLLLRLAGDFRAIAIVQHFLGLGAGALMLASWLRVRDLIRDPALPLSVHRYLGLLPVAIYLLAADTVHLELQIRPEAICGFLGMANTLCVLGFTYWFFVRGEAGPAKFYGVGTILTALLFGSVRPSFWLAALTSLLPVCFVFLRRRYRREQLALGLAMLAGLVLLVLPERWLARDDEMDAVFVPMLLFAQHADIIRDQIGDDLATAAPLPYPREQLERIHSALSAEIRKSFEANLHPYPSLGFDPEYLMYQEDSIHAQLRSEFHDDIAELCRFYRWTYTRACLHQPGRMFRKIGHQISLFYGERCPAYFWGRFLELQDDYAMSTREVGAERFRALFRIYPPAMEFIKRSAPLATGAFRLEQPAYIRYPLYSLSKRYVPCLIGALLIGCVLIAHASSRRRWGWLVAAVLFLYWSSFITCFETALVNSLEVYRYVTVQLAFVIMAQFLTLLLLLELLLAAGRDLFAGARRIGRP